MAQAEVSFEEKAATVQYDPHRVTPDQMIVAINTIGFRASRWESSSEQRFYGQGIVVAVDRQKSTVTLDHGEIQGLLPPMVMEFSVDSRDALEGLRPGDTVSFTLRPQGLTVAIADITVVKE